MVHPIRFLPLALLAFSAAVSAQETIEIDEDTVTADFDFRECRRAASNLDQTLECTARQMIFQRKFYSDGTLRSADPTRGERAVEEYLNSRRHIFICTNSGREVLRIEVIFSQQNKVTGQYVLHTEDGELQYTPNQGDLCRTARDG